MEIKHWLFPFLFLFSGVPLIFFDIDKGEPLLNTINKLLQGGQETQNWLESDRLEVNDNTLTICVCSLTMALITDVIWNHLEHERGINQVEST